MFRHARVHQSKTWTLVSSYSHDPEKVASYSHDPEMSADNSHDPEVTPATDPGGSFCVRLTDSFCWLRPTDNLIPAYDSFMIPRSQSFVFSESDRTLKSSPHRYILTAAVRLIQKLKWIAHKYAYRFNGIPICYVTVAAKWFLYE